MPGQNQRLNPPIEGVCPCIAGFWDFQTTCFTIPSFLGWDDFFKIFQTTLVFLVSAVRFSPNNSQPTGCSRGSQITTSRGEYQSPTPYAFFFLRCGATEKKTCFFFSGRFCGLETFYAVKGFQRGFFPLKVDHPGGFSGYFRMIILEETHFPNIYENDVFHKNDRENISHPKGEGQRKIIDSKVPGTGIYYI